ncbi:2-amino-4-hydroxy-6-hydroxymethyldihydropteridine diphosphokinase [Oceanibacterium hippocampi]|uniref:2-amino-4-hydroxy-6-hydroxymethyldihydropteridine pyrophosphokinase n=1 Tax=Oceanibacterium hippocampi TaxID=745714 RepID=A0A1Y5TYL3_9PROT|nr:2-amino-4-hydroxy-6-hydroxymethyldihydropteridine diphosphokinase [Oceanibacterium hippocampi]SLN77081.1 2-amino-4-hydroxy-6-hydroxymethyldihydropteridinepyrophosphokinase [Oceanibacterium hippocampi]
MVVLIGLGANLDHPVHGGPRETLLAALDALALGGVSVVRLSPWYLTRPVPDEGQPWYVNGVAQVDTVLAANSLLAMLHEIEAALGRVRKARWESRTVDLDLLDYRGHVVAPAVPHRHGVATLPHPRLENRPFVLRPLVDILPDWRHPMSGLTATELLSRLGDISDSLRPLGGAPAAAREN